jgi:hypothetical protein
MKDRTNKERQRHLQVKAVRAEIMEGDFESNAHRFRVFRLGEDVCAKCRKPRREHLREDRRR